MNKELRAIHLSMKSQASHARAKILKRFFKTGKGEYGEGDKFLGLTMPQVHKLADAHWDVLGFPQLSSLLSSPWHEERMLAVLILSRKSKQAEKQKNLKAITMLKTFYLKNKKGINNWDLIDLSAMHVLGPYYAEKGADGLLKWPAPKACGQEEWR